MAFFDQDDQINNREPHQMQVLVNTISAIGDDNIARKSFVASHLANSEGDPSILLSLWVGDENNHAEDDDESNDSSAFDFDEWALAYTIPITPQQARAVAFGLLRLADGLEIEVERGLYGNRTIDEAPVYFSEPRL